MIGQFDNQAMSSFYLWADHTLLSVGQAYSNFGSELFPVNNIYQNYYIHGSPFRQFVADSSIAGATVMSGVYVTDKGTVGTDADFNLRGSGLLSGINYGKGQSFFTGDAGDLAAKTVSGDYAIKDYNIYLTNQTEEQLLFETQFTLKNKMGLTATGLPPDSLTYPGIFLKNMGGQNNPFQLGGTQQTNMDVRAIIVADSQFLLDGACSVFRDQKDKYIDLLAENEMPFNNLGDFQDQSDPKNGYNYTNIVAAKSTNNACFIENIRVSKIGGASFAGINNVNPNTYSALVDFELQKVR